MEKFFTRMPCKRAARKWPDSCMKMMKPRRKTPAPVLAREEREERRVVERRDADGASRRKGMDRLVGAMGRWRRGGFRKKPFGVGRGLVSWMGGRVRVSVGSVGLKAGVK